MKQTGRIFISYDTREKEWALFLKDAFESHFPGVRAFVAITDIRPGSPGVATILKALRKADVIVPVCSHFSRTSPWIPWEAAAGWARRRLVTPIFLGITPNQFGGPLVIVQQGPQFDAAGVDEILEEIRRCLAPASRQRGLRGLERAVLAKLQQKAAAQGPLQVDAAGPSHFQADTNYNLCRLRVSNYGLTTIENVVVSIRDFSPQGATFLPVLLQRMHKGVPGHPHPFSLDPGAEAYFDVIQWIPGQNTFALCYDDPLLPNMIAPRRYEIEVVVSATNLPAVHTTLVAELTPNQILSLIVKP